jgi:hypothetical protein
MSASLPVLLTPIKQAERCYPNGVGPEVVFQPCGPDTRRELEAMFAAASG